MNTQFDEWLRALARAGKGPAPLTGASRGRLYREYIELPGNWAGATMRAQVRLYPDAPGDPLIQCLVLGPYVNEVTTTFIIQMTGGTGAGSTGSLPADATAEGVTYFAMDVLLKPAGDDGIEDLLFGGVLEVIGRVTA